MSVPCVRFSRTPILIVFDLNGVSTTITAISTLSFSYFLMILVTFAFCCFPFSSTSQAVFNISLTQCPAVMMSFGWTRTPPHMGLDESGPSEMNHGYLFLFLSVAPMYDSFDDINNTISPITTNARSVVFIVIGVTFFQFYQTDLGCAYS